MTKQRVRILKAIIFVDGPDLGLISRPFRPGEEVEVSGNLEKLVEEGHIEIIRPALENFRPVVSGETLAGNDGKAKLILMDGEDLLLEIGSFQSARVRIDTANGTTLSFDDHAGGEIFLNTTAFAKYKA
jgi:hypothetical protein